MEGQASSPTFLGGPENAGKGKPHADEHDAKRGLSPSSVRAPATADSFQGFPQEDAQVQDHDDSPQGFKDEMAASPSR